MVPDICPREQEFGDLTQSVLKKVVQVVNGNLTHSAVIFAGSGTAGVEAALSSLVAPDGKILILENLTQIHLVFFRLIKILET